MKGWGKEGTAKDCVKVVMAEARREERMGLVPGSTAREDAIGLGSEEEGFALVVVLRVRKGPVEAEEMRPAMADLEGRSSTVAEVTGTSMCEVLAEAAALRAGMRIVVIGGGGGTE